MKFVAFERAKQGTGASRRLRNSGRTPGIVYGGAGEPLLVELDHNALWHAIKKEAFHASVLDMELAGKESKVLLRDVQMHPYKQLILHIDFQRVDANTKMHMKVPLHFKGQEESAAFKIDHCLITHVVNEVNITCLPADLPEFIEVDLSGLKKGTSFHLSDVKLPNGVKAVVKGRENPVLVSVVAPAVEVAADPAAEAPAAGKGGKAGAKAPAAKAPAAKK
ncbi:50S ribosomal protein L25/general stress protein Ctc [Rhodoferax sp. AJA081-3]|uniref:50S ribosomal protein L25/general stress protein Ctc n=1 Tax=Rhodoferax sp. AJA081-3 TaxID=2752316 RepID=UPI001ADED6BB|nr:50S ribosomal protein L25/general stress protein Ctc [Rhodoferax sp. AJA081-3]QTN29993.1 50S ribosomal protein L25/general stress protein Ctc [Rhodoferax sp. AJA081-3]